MVVEYLHIAAYACIIRFVGDCTTVIHYSTARTDCLTGGTTYNEGDTCYSLGALHHLITALVRHCHNASHMLQLHSA